MTERTTHPPGGADTAVPAVPRFQLVQRNERAVQVLLDSTDLPHHEVEPRAHAVFITVPRLENLLPWLALLGGRVHVSPLWQELQTFSLHTATRPDNGADPVAVRVATVAPCCALAPAEIAAASCPPGAPCCRGQEPHRRTAS